MCQSIINLDLAPRSRLRPYNDDYLRSSQNNNKLQMARQCRHPVVIYPVSVYTGIQSKQLAPCGKCHFCIKSKLDMWTIRIIEEQKHSELYYFGTFTLARENRSHTISGRPTLDKRQWQLYMKRLRYHEARRLVVISVNGQSKIVRNNKKENPYWRSVKYSMSGEYGKQGDKAPHYHANLLNATAENIEKAWHECKYTKQQLLKHRNDKRFKQPVSSYEWAAQYRKLGHCTVAPLTDSRIRYTMKYMDKSKWQKENGVEMFNFPVNSKYDKKPLVSYKIYNPKILSVGADGKLHTWQAPPSVKFRSSKQESNEQKRQAKYNRAKRLGLQQCNFGLKSTGLGKDYLTPEMVAWHMADPKNRLYYNLQKKAGAPVKLPLPKYYQNKMFPPFIKYNNQQFNQNRIAEKQEEIKKWFKEDSFAEHNYNESLKAEAERLAKSFPSEMAF